MPANGPAANDDLALMQQVEAALRECTALTEAMKRARRTRLIVLVMVLAFVAAVSWVFIGLYNKFWEEPFQNELLAKARERFEKNPDTYMRQLQMLADHAGPPVEEAFQKQIRADLPRFLGSLEKERDRIAQTLESRLKDRLEHHYNHMMERQEKTLINEFPEFKDPKQHERMIKNIDLVIQKLVKRYYIDEMELQFNQLYATWDTVPPAAVSGDMMAEDLLLPELIEMLRYKLAYSQGPFLH